MCGYDCAWVCVTGICAYISMVSLCVWVCVSVYCTVYIVQCMCVCVRGVGKNVCECACDHDLWVCVWI